MADQVPEWEKLLARALARGEGHIDSLGERLARRFGDERRVVLTPYRGWGTQRELVVRGRVLLDPGLPPATPDDDMWTNVVNMYRRVASDEVPGARVEASFQGHAERGVSDAEGHFSIRVPVDRLPADTLWHEVHL